MVGERSLIVLCECLLLLCCSPVSITIVCKAILVVNRTIHIIIRSLFL